MAKPLVNASALLAALGNHFPSTANIQTFTTTPDASGEPIKTWATVTGLGAVACKVDAATGGQEVRLPDMTYVINTHTIYLAGYFAQVTELMQAVVGGVTYDILQVQQDSQSLLTKLLCRVLT